MSADYFRVFGVVRGYGFERGGKAGCHCERSREFWPEIGDGFWRCEHFIAEQDAGANPGWLSLFRFAVHAVNPGWLSLSLDLICESLTGCFFLVRRSPGPVAESEFFILWFVWRWDL